MAKTKDQAPADPPLSDAVNDAARAGKEFLAIALPPREIIMDDWFKEGDLGFIYAPRGLGKTWISLLLSIGISDAVAAGPWTSLVQWAVCYIDGEMTQEDDKGRILGLNRSMPDKLYVLNHEVLFQLHQRVLNLASLEHQQAITDLCLARQIKVLVLDNLSCLFSGVSENDADDWEVVQRWILNLRRQRIAVIVVHHTGLNTQRMRGTSKREDQAAWVLRLDEKTLDHFEPGTRFISRFTKIRGHKAVPDYEWYFQPNGAEQVEVSFKRADRADSVLQWVRDGLDTCEDIAHELGVSKGTVSKLAKKLLTDGALMKNGRRYEIP
jgi:putative DNA primase/helicase